MNDFPLITACELSDSLNDANLILFDIRGKWGESSESGLQSYRENHIPGAFFLDWTSHFIDTTKPIAEAPAPIPSEAIKSFAHFAITGEQTVVLYDDYANMFASRLWWVLRYLGYPKVKILDGGWQSWLKQGFSTEQGENFCSTVAAASAFAPVVNSAIHATTEDVVNRDLKVKLIDGRGESGFKGTPNDNRSGHIPGAINIPFRTLLNKEGKFLTASELNQVFMQKGVDPTKSEIISSCGSGYSATVVSVALKILGRNVPMYDDSFAIWKQDPNRPTEQS